MIRTKIQKTKIKTDLRLLGLGRSMRFNAFTAAAFLALGTVTGACGDGTDDSHSFEECLTDVCPGDGEDSGASGDENKPGQEGNEGQPGSDGETDSQVLSELETASGHKTVQASKPRDDGSSVKDEAFLDFTKRHRALNGELFKQLKGKFEGKNAMISTLSAQLALGMTWAGAKNETADQMARTLNFDEESHKHLNRLEILLEGRSLPAIGQKYDEGKCDNGNSNTGGKNSGCDPDGAVSSMFGSEHFDAVDLSVSNAIWTQKNIQWKSDFLDTLALYYGAGVEEMDFLNSPEPSRQFINAWVAQQTHDKIRDLIPKGVINSDTVSVLTNTVYFKAPWMDEFNEGATRSAPFNKLDGNQVQVPFVNGSERGGFAEDETWQMYQKSFRGGKLAMVFILPKEGTFSSFVDNLTGDELDRMADRLESHKVDVSLPKFKFTTTASLKDALSHLGMPLAFDPKQADFSGMTDDIKVWVDEILQKTFIALDEKGVEAAAATAVIGAMTSAMEPPPKVFKADRPFVFAIWDVETRAILFYGQVTDPSVQ